MATKLDLREFNKRNIYTFIYESDGVSKAEISAKLQLSLQTVSHNLSELKAQGLICEAGTFNSTGGRKPKIIRVVPDSYFAVGIDITKNHVGLVLIDLKCNVLHSVRLHLEFRDTPAYFEQFGKILQNFLSGAAVKVNREKILGAGVSLPAIISADGKRVTYLKIFEAADNLYEKLSAVIPFPFLLFNDANAGGAAEIRFRKSVQKIVYLSLSNSVGGAVMYTDSLYRGDNQRSGEFGHLTLKENGLPCYCGKTGCADAYCNARLLSDITDGDLSEFFIRVKNGDKTCVREFRKYLKNLSLLVHNLRMCFDCDIVLGGYVGSYMEDFIQEFSAMVSERNPFETDCGYVKSCSFKLEASAVGAALYFVRGFLKNIG
ncbi:MAG TPA: ROK family transcriptional regulator [Candidatus Treponema faecavium]|nr:ROK family transcriptional regulator [Candidatus Treponema faecavium]